MRLRGYRISALSTVVWFAASAACPCHAQESGGADGLTSIFPDYVTLMHRELEPADAATATRTPRLQLFRMPSAFPMTPLGLVNNNGNSLAPLSQFTGAGDSAGILRVSAGNHVPYLDLYKPGDPTGLGYYQVNSQVQLADSGPTSVSLVVQALTPLPLQYGGVGQGQTVVTPGLALFHDLGEGAAFHAFVGQQITSTTPFRDPTSGGFQCGFAVQHPVPFTDFDAKQGWFVFVQALGEYHTDAYRIDGKASAWDVIPGLQYRVNNACGVSMGLSHSCFFSANLQY